MDIVLLVRLAITFTFLMLAAGGPYAVIKLSRFIRRYTVAHEALKAGHEALRAEHEALKSRVETLEKAYEAPK